MNKKMGLEELYQEKFNQYPSILSKAPGRVNLIGEHIDYNGGLVFPAAIDKYATVLLGKNSLGKIRAYAKDINNYFEYQSGMKHEGWQSYIVGVIEEINKIKAFDKGIDLLITGEVPFGAGMSSSAAIECAVGTGINKLYDLGLDHITIAKAAQSAEHHFVGVQCGIMDQYASMMGKKGHAFVLDCQAEKHEYYPLELGNYQLLLCNTNVSHSLASSEYNKRRTECQAGLSILQKQFPKASYLVDIQAENIINNRELLAATVFNRCLYVTQEQQRVEMASKALKNNDLNLFGQLLYASHQGLSELYEVSCPELDFLVETTKDFDSILGSRMMGGGFGGCTINIIRTDQTEAFLEYVKPLYKQQFNKEMTPYIANIGDGASALRC